MRVPFSPAALLAFPLIAGCTPTPAEQARLDQQAAVTRTDLDKALAGLQPSPPITCLPPQAGTVASRAYGKTILYKVSNRLIYRNDTTGGCENMARGDILVSVQYQGSACQGDIARTVDPTSRFQTGSCALGPFVRYSRP